MGKEGPMPEQQTRNTIRVQISMLPSDLLDLDALAARLAEPGLEPNRSAAFRTALRGYLNAEADAEASRRRKARP